jgi:hypothetical protein
VNAGSACSLLPDHDLVGRSLLRQPTGDKDLVIEHLTAVGCAYHRDLCTAPPTVSRSGVEHSADQNAGGRPGLDIVTAGDDVLAQPSGQTGVAALGNGVLNGLGRSFEVDDLWRTALEEHVVGPVSGGVPSHRSVRPSCGLERRANDARGDSRQRCKRNGRSDAPP